VTSVTGRKPASEGGESGGGQSPLIHDSCSSRTRPPFGLVIKAQITAEGNKGLVTTELTVCELQHRNLQMEPTSGGSAVAFLAQFTLGSNEDRFLPVVVCRVAGETGQTSLAVRLA